MLTGIKKYRYVKTGTNQYSFAFTYARMAATGYPGGRGWRRYLKMEVKKLNDGRANGERLEPVRRVSLTSWDI